MYFYFFSIQICQRSVQLQWKHLTCGLYITPAQDSDNIFQKHRNRPIISNWYQRKKLKAY